MLKQLILVLIISIGVAYFSTNLAAILHLLTNFQHGLANLIASALPHEINKSSLLISKTIALITLPFIIVLIPAFFYWLAKHKEMPHLSPTIWIIWVISSLVFVLER
jgi:hypothetical protein